MVNTYLAAHSLESTIEEAVNDAVLKQVKVRCPFRTRVFHVHAVVHAVGGLLACAESLQAHR
jgi:hypothetical protein